MVRRCDPVYLGGAIDSRHLLLLFYCALLSMCANFICRQFRAMPRHFCCALRPTKVFLLALVYIYCCCCCCCCLPLHFFRGKSFANFVVVLFCAAPLLPRKLTFIEKTKHKKRRIEWIRLCFARICDAYLFLLVSRISFSVRAMLPNVCHCQQWQ